MNDASEPTAAGTTVTGSMLHGGLAELAALDGPRARANRLKTQHGLAQELWETKGRAAGERLEVFKDYPTPPNCTTPFAPVWISEMVRRRSRAQRES